MNSSWIFLCARVAGVLHQGFLEGEVRQRVVHQLLDHLGDRRVFLALLGVVQVIDHLDDAFVLIVDDLNTGIQVILPDQMRHDDFPQANSERPFRTAWGQGIFVTQYGY